MTEEKLALTTEWDKTFPKSDAVDHEKVTFHNRYGITLAADLYRPLDATTPLPAIAVCGPFGAVKEQCSGLYAQALAERGFLTIAFDPHTQENRAAHLGTWRARTSTPRTSVPRWTTSAAAMTSMQSAWASSASAAGEGWR